MSAARLPHYLRFAKALAFASGAATAGCDGGVLFAPDAATNATPDAGDATLEVAGDASLDAADAGDANGSCRIVALDAALNLACPPGFACSFPDDAEVRCTYGVDAAGDGGENQECGSITCGEYCYCIGPAANVCGCFQGPSGPCSPPDLPRDIMSAHAGSLPSLRPRAHARLGRRRHRV